MSKVCDVYCHFKKIPQTFLEEFWNKILNTFNDGALEWRQLGKTWTGSKKIRDGVSTNTKPMFFNGHGTSINQFWNLLIHSQLGITSSPLSPHELEMLLLYKLPWLYTSHAMSLLASKEILCSYWYSGARTVVAVQGAESSGHLLPS